MRIITLTGKKNCGKSTTLNFVYNLLLSSGGVSTAKKVEGNQNFNDFSDIVNYNGLKIAFFTMGDYDKNLIEAIDYYDAFPVDVLVCACNLDCSVALNDIKTYTHSLISKTLAFSIVQQFGANTMDAIVVFGTI